jgi:hypothetical protein
MVIPVVIDKVERPLRIAHDPVPHRKFRHWRKIADLNGPEQLTCVPHISFASCSTNLLKLLD